MEVKNAGLVKINRAARQPQSDTFAAHFILRSRTQSSHTIQQEDYWQIEGNY
jgi:hypothetical protein